MKTARSSKLGVMEMTEDEEEAGRGESFEVFSIPLDLAPRLPVPDPDQTGGSWSRGKTWG
jgi:hypothetical protein